MVGRSVVWDGLKLLILGSVIETTRRIFMWVIDRFRLGMISFLWRLWHAHTMAHRLVHICRIRGRRYLPRVDHKLLGKFFPQIMPLSNNLIQCHLPDRGKDLADTAQHICQDEEQQAEVEARYWR